MNKEEFARLKTDVQQGGRDGPGNGRGLKLAGVRHLPRRSVEILRDLGLSQEKIDAYDLRFPTPTSMRRGHRPLASRMRLDLAGIRDTS